MSIQRVEAFEALAAVYRTGGFAVYSEALAPTLLSLAFDYSWTGRTLLDLGCGSGDLATWFAGRQFRVNGIDSVQQMVEQAEALAMRQNADRFLAVSDIRSFRPTMQYDMVTCIGGTLNYMTSLRDLQAVFKVAQTALAPGKLFYFDLYTIQGLADGAGERVITDNDQVMVVSRSEFNYETLAQTVQCSIFQEVEDRWTRAEETHVLRGYPLQPLTKLLENCGLRLLRTFAPDVLPVRAVRANDMAVFVCVRE
ncbi:MAG: class I SAM-dependent methyltransferase [Anaerolineae bacterium]